MISIFQLQFRASNLDVFRIKPKCFRAIENSERVSKHAYLCINLQRINIPGPDNRLAEHYMQGNAVTCTQLISSREHNASCCDCQLVIRRWCACVITYSPHPEMPCKRKIFYQNCTIIPHTTVMQTRANSNSRFSSAIKPLPWGFDNLQNKQLISLSGSHFGKGGD